MFAYSIETECDGNGWILDYSVHPGNEHDGRTFPTLYEKLKKYDIKTMVMDAGYKNPAIAKLLIDEDITPLFPCKRPHDKERLLPKA